MQNLHLKLTSKYPKYNNWHQTKHHNKVHWGVFIVFTFLVFITISRWTPISLAADTVAPTTPANLTATAISSSQINLSWTASTDNTAVTGYKIYRCAGLSCSPTVQIATSATNSYSDTGLTASTAYTYAISAFDAAGNESGKSGSVNGTTQAPPTSINPIDNLKSGEWYEVPNSHLRDVTPPFPDYTIGRFSSIIDAWNSGAYDIKRDRYIITGGGHNDYGGNELYAFDINTLKWSRVWGPSPNIPAPVSSSCFETYDDGNPRSRHTYDQLEYLPNVDRFYMGQGSLYCTTGGTGNATWTFDFNTLQWSRKSDLAYRSEHGMVSAYDPFTGHLFVAGTMSWQALLEYDPVSDIWTRRGDVSIDVSQTAAIDIKRKKFISIGSGRVFAYDLKPTGTLIRQILTTTGANEITSVAYPGVDYDPVSDRIVAWHGGGSVYTLDMDTLVWTKHITTSTRVPSAGLSNGTFNRWHYVPSKNVFIIANSIDENVYVYKLSSGSGTPLPSDTTPPTVPTSLTATAVSSSQVNLLWNASMDSVIPVQVTSGIIGYKVYQCQGSGCAPTTRIATTGNVTSYSDAGLSANTTYTYAVSAFDAAGNESPKSASVSQTTGQQPSSGRIDTPVGVFVALGYPDPPPVGIGNSKHVTWAHNPIDGRLYSMGGDFGDGGYPPGSFSSYRQDMYSFSVAERWANRSDRNAGWRQEFPYCGPPGSVQPKSPDFVGWTWDSNRNVFWMSPGTMVTPGAETCLGRTVSGDDDPQFKMNNMMTFDPFEPDLAKRWKDWGPVTRTFIPGENWMSVYDAQTDTIIHFSNNETVDIYDPKTNSWTSMRHASNAIGNTVRIYDAALSPDFEKRVIYAVDQYAGRLMRWNMDTRTMTDIGPVPDGAFSTLNINSSFTAWDSVNKVLHFFHPITFRLHVYHPDTQTWETPPIVTDPPGITPKVNHAIVFDPYQNVLVFLGNRDDNTPYDFFYRYGNGSGTPPTAGNVINANPTNYLSLLPTLKPGDTLLLESGTYTANGLPVDTLNGISGQPITIKGSDTGSRPVIVGSAGQNTVRIRNSSHVIIKNLEIDGRNLGGDPVNGESTSHHITLENLYIHGFSDDQGTVGISTNQAPVWNWTIRNNIITDGGTGMYLGNSPGTEPFIGGLIEGNLIYDTIGYNIEIKHQLPRPTNIPGMPTAPQKTIIRHNVFSKANKASTGGMARPNLLVGHFPLSGSGQDDRYEIYGNFFYQNPTGEPLFQGEGNIGLYNNLFFNSVAPASSYAAVHIAPHNDKPRDIRIFHNTVVTKDKGISVSGGYTTFQQKVIANAVFAATPISAPDQQDNITDTYVNTINYLVSPFALLGTFDLYPLANKLTGTTLDTASYNTYTDWNKDFNGGDHTHTFRGAYTKEGQNSGWLPKMERKPIASGSVPRDTTAPTIPTNLTATTVSSTQINLSWTASTDDVGVTGYKIYRCVGSGCAPTQSVNSLIYNDTGLSPSTAYTYAVSAYDAAGNESGKSQLVSVTTLSSFKPSDLNQDGLVNQLDFDILKQDWARTDKPKSDLNQDGIVNSQDLGIMMSEWTR